MSAAASLPSGPVVIVASNKRMRVEQEGDQAGSVRFLLALFSACLVAALVGGGAAVAMAESAAAQGSSASTLIP